MAKNRPKDDDNLKSLKAENSKKYILPLGIGFGGGGLGTGVVVLFMKHSDKIAEYGGKLFAWLSTRDLIFWMIFWIICLIALVLLGQFIIRYKLIKVMSEHINDPNANDPTIYIGEKKWVRISFYNKKQKERKEDLRSQFKVLDKKES